MQTMQLTKQKTYILVILGLIFISIFAYFFIKLSSVEVVSANSFKSLLKEKAIKELYIKDKYIYLVTSKKIYKTLTTGINIKELSRKYPIKTYIKSSKYLNYIAVVLLASILIAILFILKQENTNQPSLSLNSSKDLIESNNIKPIYETNITFNDVVGIDDVKEDLEEIVEFLKAPFKFQSLGLKMPKGLLLVGPPGVGKTLLAKAIASEAGVPFFYHSGANFVQIYAGMGAKRVKELFDKAKKMAPSIIFIDEIDAVGKNRDSLNNEEREATLNQLLIEMDGFEDNLGVIVIGATNRVDILDSALLRPGRFDRRVFIELPNIKEREQILKYYLKDKKYNFDIKEIVKITSGFSPAALEVLINEAALDAYKQKSNIITIKHIYNVKDRVIYGKKRINLYSKKEKEIISLSQAAKAVVASWLGFRFDKLSLFSPFDVKKEGVIVSKSMEIDRLKVYLSGIIFLEQEFKDIFSISIEDQKKIALIIKDLQEFYHLSEYEFTNYLKDIKEMVQRLKKAIYNVAKELEEKEFLSYSEIKRQVDEIF